MPTQESPIGNRTRRTTYFCASCNQEVEWLNQFTQEELDTLIEEIDDEDIETEQFYCRDCDFEHRQEIEVRELIIIQAFAAAEYEHVYQAHLLDRAIEIERIAEQQQEEQYQEEEEEEESEEEQTLREEEEAYSITNSVSTLSDLSSCSSSDEESVENTNIQQNGVEKTPKDNQTKN